MKKLKKENLKQYYLKPTIKRLGDINTKTLGRNQFDTDNNSNAAACKSQTPSAGSGVICS